MIIIGEQILQSPEQHKISSCLYSLHITATVFLSDLIPGEYKILHSDAKILPIKASEEF